jgi:acyl-CoA reductase-like NAD-dependent aldehyde dehydrogenase
VIVKTLRKGALTLQAIFRLTKKPASPKGVVQMVQGDAGTVTQLLNHPMIKNRFIRGFDRRGKESLCAGNRARETRPMSGRAKNPIVVMPMPIQK